MSAGIRAQFDQVLMDEYQDTNGLQARLVELVRPSILSPWATSTSPFTASSARPDAFRAFRDGAAAGKRLVNLPENFHGKS